MSIVMDGILHLDLSSSDGNAFTLLATANRYATKMGLDDEEKLKIISEMQSGDYNNLAIDESDLVIAIGYDLVEYSPSAWNRIEKGQKNVIHIQYS